MAKPYKEATKTEDMDFDQRWEIMHKEKKKLRALQQREKSLSIRRVFTYSLEVLAVSLSYLERSRIVRFITAKLTLDTVVEVTAHFGRDAGHRLSTVLAMLTAEPYLIAVVLTGIFLVLNFVGFLSDRSRRKKLRKLAEKTGMH
ncbi:MAG: hypothetical protein IJ899_17385 [Blautia sp.]|nr:hypothetical protein [Blautia sp.]